MATAKQIIDLALSQMGVAEVGETNNVKYNTEYYGHTVHDPDPTTGEYVYPWCGVLCLYGGCSGMPMLPASFAVAKKPHTQVMSMTTIES